MKFPPTATHARLSEIFSSLQGEGLYLGQKHIFVRFEECNIHCAYCDELDKAGKVMSVDEVVAEIERLEKESGPHAFVSLTGGEPLLYLAFLKPLLAEIKRNGFKTYLETSGILWQALKEVLDLCDVIAMDVKPSSVTKEKNFDVEHRRFLEIASRKNLFIKMVVSKEIKTEEFDAQIALVHAIMPGVPVVLLPLSAEKEGHEDANLMALLEKLQRRGSTKHADIRIVPRFHKILKIR